MPAPRHPAAFVAPLPLAHSLSVQTVHYACPGRSRRRHRHQTAGRGVNVAAAASPPARRPSSSSSPSSSPPPPPVPSSSSSAPPPPSAAKTATVIVPGKFDAFHLGHRKLAAAAASLGRPTMLSFAGMAAALGWAPRAPVLAPVERSRVLRDWAMDTGSQIDWAVVPFPDVREMSPEEFIDFLIATRDASAIVCGPNWRFGRRRAGDVALLTEIASDRGLAVRVVEPEVRLGAVVSSTRVREALAQGNVADVALLLGRRHRLVGYVLAVNGSAVLCGGFVNMVPGDGAYHALIRVIGRAEPFEGLVEVWRDEDGEPVVTITDARRVYCAECEIYIDFVDRAAAP